MYKDIEASITILDGTISDDNDSIIIYMQAHKNYTNENNTNENNKIRVVITIQDYDKYLENQKEYDADIDKFKLRVARL